MLSVGEGLTVGLGVSEGFGVYVGAGDGEGFFSGVAEPAGEGPAVISGEEEIAGGAVRKAVGFGEVDAVFCVAAVEGNDVFVPGACSEPHPVKQRIKNKRNKTVHDDFFIDAAMAFILRKSPFFERNRS